MQVGKLRWRVKGVHRCFNSELHGFPFQFRIYQETQKKVFLKKPRETDSRAGVLTYSVFRGDCATNRRYYQNVYAGLMSSIDQTKI